MKEHLKAKIPFEVKPSKHGLGVFATRKIARNEAIYAVQTGFPLISYQQLLRKRVTDNPLQISPRRYLDWRAPGVIFNHSCKPNVGLTSYPRLAFIALRDIKRGEELRWDYSTSIDCDTECDFDCDCGAKACRKHVGGFKWLPARLKKQYIALGVVQKYLLKER